MFGESTTEEYWDVDGTSLSQLGWNVETVGGDRWDLPRRRGDNVRFAYNPGTSHRNKIADARTISLRMWMVGLQPNGAVPENMIRQFNDNWEYLRRLVWKANGAQVALTRRRRLTSAAPVGNLDPAAEIEVTTALAEHVGTMTPTMNGRIRNQFVLEFLLADPFFYGPSEATELRTGVPRTVVNTGTDIAAYTRFSVEISDGPVLNPKLTNHSVSPAVVVAYTGQLEIGDVLSLNVSRFQARKHNVASGPTSSNVVGLITHSGARNWFGLMPGPNVLSLTAESGAARALVRWQAPYV